MTHRASVTLAFTGAALATLLLAGCEEVVYRNRELFNPPADTTSGFLGYFSVAEKQTTCGNCHTSFQAAWSQTKHAHAGADLEASGHASDACWGCHAVSEKGNALTVPAGYSVVHDSAYRDVQCESCHGPGYQHVLNPTRETRPLASIKADTGLTNGCGECHSGVHSPFVEQWKQSAHGSGPGFNAAATNATCAPCHEGRTAIAVKFNDPAEYIEKSGATPQRIVCAVCHNPHGSENSAQLRASIAEPTRDNLCVKCHAREGEPSPGSATRRGPHAAQGLLVIDEDVGWIPPNFELQYDTSRIVGTHGTEANPRLCASCHVTKFDVTDQATGDFLLTSVGHTFEPIRCLDAQGLPTDGPCAVDQRDFRGCAVSGCHGSASAARTAFVTVKARMEYLTDQLWSDSNGNAVLDTTDAGLLPKVLKKAIAAGKRNEMNLYDRTLTTAEGAIWNAQLAYTHGRTFWSGFKIQGQNSCSAANCTAGDSSNSAHYSSGEGVHNPFLLEALLTASIQAVQGTYAVAPPQAIDLTVHAAPPPGLRTARR